MIKTFITLSIIIFTYTLSSSNINILHPQSLNHKGISNQFKSYDKQAFVPLIGNNVNLRSKPSLNSKIVCQLSILQRVTILYRNPQLITIGNKKGHWVFVKIWNKYDDYKKKNPTGWIFDYYLGYKNQFKKNYTWNFCKKLKIIFISGVSFIFQRNGSYSSITGSKYYKSTGKNHIKVYRNIIFLESDGFRYFFKIDPIHGKILSSPKMRLLNMEIKTYPF